MKRHETKNKNQYKKVPFKKQKEDYLNYKEIIDDIEDDVKI